MELKDFFDSYKNGKFFDFKVIATREVKSKDGKVFEVGDISKTISATSYEELKREVKLFVTLCCSEAYGISVKTLYIEPEVKSEEINLTFMAEDVDFMKKYNPKNA